MAIPLSATDYGIWLCPEPLSNLVRSAPAQKLQITITNQENKKGLLGLPLELRASIMSHAIEHRQGNTVFIVDARDARHIANDLSCRACDHSSPGWRRWLSARRPRLARFPIGGTADLITYVPPKDNISFWACRHRLIPNAKALRLTSRQLNTEIIDFLTCFSNGRSVKFMFVDVCGPAAQIHLSLGLLINAASLAEVDITIPFADVKALMKVLRQRTRPLTPSIVLCLMDDPGKNSWEDVQDLITMHRHTNVSLLKNLVYRMHSVTIFIRRSLDKNAVAAISIHEQCEYDRPNCHIALEEAFLDPVLQCIDNQERPFTSLKVEIVNRTMKLRKLRKMLAPLMAIKVERAHVRCVRKPGKWKKGYARLMMEVRDAMMEKSIMVDVDGEYSEGRRLNSPPILNPPEVGG